jgi:two-component system, chemotaxis family, protein-glutamate methylesterase/glutaminase
MAPQERRGAPEGAARKTVMIVDDAAMMRSVLSQLLAAAGTFDVLATCDTGRAALDALAGHDPDIILVDIEMPVMNGIEFLRRARIRTRAKIIVLSASAETGSAHAREARRLGADAVLSKPSGPVSPDLIERSGEHILRALANVAH